MSYFRSFKEIFIFSSDEKVMAVVVFIVIFCLTVFNYTNHYWHTAKPIPPERIAELNAIAEQISDKQHQKTTKNFFRTEAGSFRQKSSGTLFAFNPNTLDSSGWVALGFSPRQTSGIMKFRAKGGTFKKKSDMRKLYCVDDEIYRKLEPFILLPDEVQFTPPGSELKDSGPTEQKTDSKKKIQVELNTADTTDLKMLPGIGSFYARKIVEYRESLGGYRDVEQLLEIWKFGEERLEKIIENIVIDTLFVHKVEINVWDKEQLKRHPYISSQLANMMVNYRKHHGPYKRPSDLRKLVLVNDSIFRKLTPYIQFSP